MWGIFKEVNVCVYMESYIKLDTYLLLNLSRLTDTIASITQI